MKAGNIVVVAAGVLLALAAAPLAKKVMGPKGIIK